MTFHNIFVTFPLICWLSGELEEGPGRWALAANLYNARLVQHDILQEGWSLNPAYTLCSLEWGGSFGDFFTIAGESFEKTCDFMLCLQCLTIFEQSEINKCVFLEAGGERALHFTWGLRGRETGANFGTDKKTWCRMPWQGASRKGLSPLRDQDPDPINWVSALVTGYWPLLIRWISMTSGESDKAELRWFRTGWAFWGFIPPLWMQIIATGTLRISNWPR